jgi:site-specific DNA-cytosine methylase
LGFIREFEPETLVIENVDGFLSAALEHVSLVERERRPLTRREMKGSFLEWVLLELDGLGYSVAWGVAEAADYGVPQYRQRAILIGTRRSNPCYLPGASTSRARTVREGLQGIGDPGPIQPLSDRKRAIYALIPAGGNWRSLPVEVQRETMGRAFFATGGKSGWWRRLAWDLPAPTILGMPDHSSTGLIHPDEVRCLGLNECAALQSFPSQTPFRGSARAQYQQVGNAVPPLLGAAIGRALLDHLEGRSAPVPSSPPWRSESANRRIGTHGWMLRRGNRALVTMNAKVRPTMCGRMRMESSSLSPERLALIAKMRASCGVLPDEGPTDQDISNALDGFAGQFDYWFERVIANAVKDYRKLIVKRINPFVRGIEYEGFNASTVAGHLVRDYTNRNFVTAGGWAIERMAIALGSKNAKAAATGIDLHKIDPKTGSQYLYVIKSGMVTRNSDILSSLKRHAEQARKLLMQGGSKVSVFANYAVAAGATSSTYHDNIHRPSSAAFWAEVTELTEDKAMRLAYAISQAAGKIIKRESEPHIRAMETLIGHYVGKREDAAVVDWEFLFDRTMKERKEWATEDASRHKAAWAALLATGYKPESHAASAPTDAALEDDPDEAV